MGFARLLIALLYWYNLKGVTSPRLSKGWERGIQLVLAGTRGAGAVLSPQSSSLPYFSSFLCLFIISSGERAAQAWGDGVTMFPVTSRLTPALQSLSEPRPNH